MSKLICNPEFERKQRELTEALIRVIIVFIGSLFRKGGK